MVVLLGNVVVGLQLSFGAHSAQASGMIDKEGLSCEVEDPDPKWNLSTTHLQFENSRRHLEIGSVIIPGSVSALQPCLAWVGFRAVDQKQQ